MYSPKISDDLIPTLYQLSKKKIKPMTKIGNEILREKLAAYHSSGTTIHPDLNIQTTDEFDN